MKNRRRRIRLLNEPDGVCIRLQIATHQPVQDRPARWTAWCGIFRNRSTAHRSTDYCYLSTMHLYIRANVGASECFWKKWHTRDVSAPLQHQQSASLGDDATEDGEQSGTRDARRNDTAHLVERGVEQNHQRTERKGPFIAQVSAHEPVGEQSSDRSWKSAL